MATSLSNLVDNLKEGIHKIKCKDYDYFLAYKSVKNNSIKYKCSCYNKNCSNKIDEELKRDSRTHSSCFKNDINKFILLLRKGVCLCEYTDDWEKFNETPLSKKEEFYSNLIYGRYYRWILHACKKGF